MFLPSAVWRLPSRELPLWLQMTAAAAWPSRAMHGLLAYADRLWLLGGLHMDASSGSLQRVGLNDVWSSANGVDWSLATAEAPWTIRAGHAAVVGLRAAAGGGGGDSVMYLLGGRGRFGDGTDVFLNDVWRSGDGVAWDPVTASAPW